MNNQLRNYKNWILILVLLFGGVLYIGSSLMNNDDESAFKENQNDVHIWSSNSPEYVMSEKEAKININNIKAMHKEGWKLFVHNGQPVSFNPKVSGRNKILEQSASNLLQGAYEMSIDADGNIIDIKVSEEATKLLEEQQKQIQAEKDKKKQVEQQYEHDIQFNIVQNNITDINRFMEIGYRYKMSDDGKGTIVTWNINNQEDTSPGLEYSINRLMSYGISVKSDKAGRVVGFDFSQTEFYEYTYELYGMIE